MRVVTIKHPPPAVEGITSDHSTIGRIYDLAPQVAIPMIAAGWMRGETRTRARRQRELSIAYNRRQPADRRSVD